MALSAEEIKQLKAMPDSPTKRLMMQAAGVQEDEAPEAAFTKPAIGVSGMTVATPTGAPMHNGAVSDDVLAGQYLQGPSKANDLFQLPPKPIGTAAGKAISGKSTAKGKEDMGHYWTEDDSLQGPSTEPEAFGMPPKPVSSAAGKSIASATKDDGPELAFKQPDSPLPKTLHGQYDVDKLVQQGAIKPETAAAYKAKLAEDAGRAGGMMTRPEVHPTAAPPPAPASWVDKVKNHFKPASVEYDYQQGNVEPQVTVGPVTQLEAGTDKEQFAPSKLKLEQEEWEGLSTAAKGKWLQNVHKRLDELESRATSASDKRKIKELRDHMNVLEQEEALNNEAEKSSVGYNKVEANGFVGRMDEPMVAIPNANTEAAAFKRYGKKQILDI